MNWTPRQKPSKEIMQGHYCRLEALDITLHGSKLFTVLQCNEDAGKLWTYLPFGPFDTYEEFNDWLNQASINKIYFTIIDVATNTPKGLASFHDVDIEHGVIEVGSIIYSNSLQKTCAATEAMYLMMQRVFDEHGYRRYQWRCNALNQASCKAAERLGFQFEGIFRQSNVYKQCNRDTAWYSIIDNEWPMLKSKFQKWLTPNNFDDKGQQILKLQEIK